MGIKIKTKKVIKVIPGVTPESIRAKISAVKADVQSRSPVDTGEYKQGWAAANIPNGAVVYNAGRHTTLKPLLEHGHMANGKYVPPRPHIVPVFNKWADYFMSQARKNTKLEL